MNTPNIYWLGRDVMKEHQDLSDDKQMENSSLILHLYTAITQPLEQMFQPELTLDILRW